MKQYRTKTGKDRGGQRWKTRTVYDVLTDKKYIGKIEHKGIAYDGEHDAIVDEVTFEKVAEVLRSNKVYTHRHQVTRFALLRRMLRCAECASAVQPVWTKNHGREYRYYTCSKRIKTGYAKCTLPSLPAGEIETMVVDQLREILRQPDVIAQTYREVAASGPTGLNAEQTARLEDLRTRRHQAESAIRSLLALDGQSGPFIQSELGRLNGELNTLNHSITELEATSPSAGHSEANLADIAAALQRLDPIWEVLIPDEQRRVLELLVEKIIVGKNQIEVAFRTDGVEQIAIELTPLGESTKGRKAK